MTRQFSAIHQFHSGISQGDAISAQIFDLQRAFHKLGYRSDIYAEHIYDNAGPYVHHIDDFVSNEDELLLVHHSMGHRRLSQIFGFFNPIITVYHNITPAQYLADDEHKHFSHIGRYQLDALATRSIMGIADSNYNRMEMFQRGFTKVDVIPVKTSFHEFQSARELRNPERDWLFVGRIAPNKQQVEIVKAFHHYHHNFENSARLFLVGSHAMRSYTEKLGREIKKLDLLSQVDAPGMIDEVALLNRYARAGVFISLSRHEGFGVPLLEAMAVGIPVVALQSSAVTETMGGAGILLQSAEPGVVSSAVQRVMTDHEYREQVIWRQDRRLEKLMSFDTQAALLRVLDYVSGKNLPIRVQVQGPIESSYSLAILNREAAFQLSSQTDFDVSVYPTEGPGDYAPKLDELNGIPGLPELYERGLQTSYPDVVVRQMFPPRVKDTTASLTIQYFGWEESLVPTEFVKDFNEHVHRVMVMSGFVKDALRNSGVTIPIDVVGVGVRPPMSDETVVIEELQNLKRVRLLHISSAFPRKGVDVLLNAYFCEFSGDDDITLILKTFPNQHNAVEEQILHLTHNHPNPPHVAWINRDLPMNHLGNLYRSASAYVHLARGEGFGLPVAEAMLAKVPVISTASSGLADFVDESTASVIPSVLTKADSHVSIPGSQWYEPDELAVRAVIRSLYSGTKAEERASKVQSAYERIGRDFSWEAVGDRVINSVRSTLAEPKSIKVKHLTTFNSRCGIAEYSSLFQAALPKNVFSETIADKNVLPLDWRIEENTVRLWEQLRHQDVNVLVSALQIASTDIIHLQYNFGFFSMEDLSELVALLDGSKPIVITLHRTKDLDRGHEIVSLAHATDALRKVSAIIVHEQHDVHRLAGFGITGNVVHIPHAAMPFMGSRSARSFSLGDELRIGTFGFLLPHKGLDVSLAAVHSLNNQGKRATLKALCSLHPDPSSAATYDRIVSTINEHGLSSFVSLDTEYKNVEEIHTELSDVDVIVLPYSQTQESASGVLAMLLSIGKPIIATDLDIFAGARDALITIAAPAEADDLTATLLNLVRDTDRMVEMGERARKRSLDISWGHIGQQTTELYKSLLAN
jgi:glycosyltransferase involved in cell wall biosynthesis